MNLCFLNTFCAILQHLRRTMATLQCCMSHKATCNALFLAVASAWTTLLQLRHIAAAVLQLQLTHIRVSVCVALTFGKCNILCSLNSNGFSIPLNAKDTNITYSMHLWVMAYNAAALCATKSAQTANSQAAAQLSGHNAKPFRAVNYIHSFVGAFPLLIKF